MPITTKPIGSVSAPNELTEKAAGAVAIPIELTEKAVVDPSIPNQLTEKAATTPSAPNQLVEQAVVDPSIPNTLTEKGVGVVAAPNQLTELVEGGIAAPIELTEKVVGAVVAPNQLTEKAATIPSAPNELTESVVAGFPRALEPLVGMDFASQLYMQDNRPVLFDDLFTYSRNSNATFWNRRVNRNGKYEYFLDTDYVGNVENLLTYSENMAGADWTITGTLTVTETSLRTPDGAKAYLIDDTDTSADNGKLNNTFTIPNDSLTRCMSILLKRGDRDQIGISVFNTNGTNVSLNSVIDINSGTIISGGENAWIIYEGDGWWRFSKLITNNSSGNTSFIARIYPATNVVSEIGSVYASQAQVVIGNKSLPYVKTISAAVTETFTEDLRIEYNPSTGEALGALIEGGVTNLFLNSEEFDNVSWLKTNSAVVANNSLAPDETTSADHVSAASTASISPSIFDAITSVISSVYTNSFYVKKAEADIVQIRYDASNVTGSPRANYDLGNGVLGSVDAEISASIEDVGNGYYRISSTVTSASTSLVCYLVLIKSATDTRAQANSWTAGDGIHVWGAQCELLSFASSYIRTESGAVARAIDGLSLSSAGNFNEQNGSIVLNSSMIALSDVGQTMMIISDGTNVDRTQITIGATNKISAFISASSVTQANLASLDDIIPNITDNIVLNYQSNNADLIINGVSVGSDTSVITPVSLTTINLGTAAGGSTSPAYCHIKKAECYEEILTLQEINLL